MFNLLSLPGSCIFAYNDDFGTVFCSRTTQPSCQACYTFHNTEERVKSVQYNLHFNCDEVGVILFKMLCNH